MVKTIGVARIKGEKILTGMKVRTPGMFGDRLPLPINALLPMKGVK